MAAASSASSTRLAIPADKECTCCFEPVNGDSVCEYKTSGGAWLLGNYCCVCVQYLVDNQFATYKKSVEASTCKRELTALITAGPPIYVSDKLGLPVGEGEHISALYFGSDKKERSSRLTGALEGEEREKLWEFYRAFSSSKMEQADDDS
eukprot:m.229510 g.229510  ORF g.229510 m.229510 type:complete len:150 (+) comp17762_c0_seq1:295-744(+)